MWQIKREREREIQCKKNYNGIFIERIVWSINDCHVGDEITMSEFYRKSSRKSDFSGVYGNFTLIFRHVLITKKKQQQQRKKKTIHQKWMRERFLLPSVDVISLIWYLKKKVNNKKRNEKEQSTNEDRFRREVKKKSYIFRRFRVHILKLIVFCVRARAQESPQSSCTFVICH